MNCSCNTVRGEPKTHKLFIHTYLVHTTGMDVQAARRDVYTAATACVVR